MKSDFCAKMADPVLLLPLILQRLYSRVWENRIGDTSSKMWKLESRQINGNQLRRYEKLNLKVALRINLIHTTETSKDSKQAAPSTSENGSGDRELLKGTLGESYLRSLMPASLPIPVSWQESSPTLSWCILWRGKRVNSWTLGTGYCIKNRQIQ